MEEHHGRTWMEEHHGRTWMEEHHGGYDDVSVVEAIRKVQERMPQHKIACEQNEKGLIVVLVTDYMLRVHKEMKSSSEVMFVNITSHVDQTSSLTMLVFASPAGGFPLGVIITSTQTKEDCVKGKRII